MKLSYVETFRLEIDLLGNLEIDLLGNRFVRQFQYCVHSFTFIEVTNHVDHRRNPGTIIYRNDYSNQPLIMWHSKLKARFVNAQYTMRVQRISISYNLS